MKKILMLLFMVLCRLCTYGSVVNTLELENEECLMSQNSQMEFPTYPKIVKVTIAIDSIDWFWSDDELPLISGVMELEIETSHATEIVMKMADNDWFFSFDAFNYPWPKYPFFSNAWLYDVDPNESRHILRTDDINIGAFYRVFSANKIGVAIGDTILINDYIDDPELQKAIRDYQEKHAAIYEVEADEPDIQFVYGHDRIIIKDESNIVQTLVVYSMSGQVVLSQNGNGDIDISNYPIGMYIIKYYTVSDYGTFKFIKR